MKKIMIGTTAVYCTPIEQPVGDASEARRRDTRRRREREAVGRIAAEAGISIGHDADGAPMADGVFVSVSHSMGLAVVAVDPRRPVGIDAEDWREALWRVRPKFLSETEMERCADADSLLRAWTAKEAAYKAAPAPRPQMSEIECAAGFGSATACGRRYALVSWLEGPTRLTLAYPADDDE